MNWKQTGFKSLIWTCLFLRWLPSWLQSIPSIVITQPSLCLSNLDLARKGRPRWWLDRAFLTAVGISPLIYNAVSSDRLILQFCLEPAAGPGLGMNQLSPGFGIVISWFSLNLPCRQMNRKAEQGSWHQDVVRHVFLLAQHGSSMCFSAHREENSAQGHETCTIFNRKCPGDFIHNDPGIQDVLEDKHHLDYQCCTHKLDFNPEENSNHFQFCLFHTSQQSCMEGVSTQECKTMHETCKRGLLACYPESLQTEMWPWCTFNAILYCSYRVSAYILLRVPSDQRNLNMQITWGKVGSDWLSRWLLMAMNDICSHKPRTVNGNLLPGRDTPF